MAKYTQKRKYTKKAIKKEVIKPVKSAKKSIWQKVNDWVKSIVR